MPKLPVISAKEAIAKMNGKRTSPDPQAPATDRSPVPVVPHHLPGGCEAKNVRPVGYCDMNGRPAFKMSIREHEGRWYIYTGSFWHSGWSIVDVTDPSAPRVVKFIEGPANTWTLQIDISGTTMITSLEKIFPNFGGDPGKAFNEGVLIWDISDPVKPRQLGQFRTGGSGTHRNFYAGGRYMHLAAGMPGYSGNIYVIVDISNPAEPVEAGRWWVPGQHTAGNEKPLRPDILLHGPPYVVGNSAYLPYGSALIILDISDVSKPVEIGRLDFSPPFHSKFGVHSALPIPEHRIVFANSEDTSYGKGPAHHASIIDISNPREPFLLSLFPEPVPSSGAPYLDFSSREDGAGLITSTISSTTLTSRSRGTCSILPISMQGCGSMMSETRDFRVR